MILVTPHKYLSLSLHTHTDSQSQRAILHPHHRYIPPFCCPVSSKTFIASYGVVFSCLSPCCSLCFTMRQEENPLDLNNLPEDYGKQGVESSTTTATSSVDTAARVKRKSCGGGKDDGKVYECRFCSLKFCKSQALGGHMNRHRQERETETLNRARQLVLGNESLAAVGAQMSFRDVDMAGATPPSLLAGGFRGVVTSGGGGGIGDPCLPFRPVHQRLSPQPPYHYLYTAPSTLHPMSYPATYPGPPHQPAVGDYVIGHAVSAGDALMQPQPHRGSFSCVGAPFTAPPTAAANVQADKANCNCSFACGGHSRNNNVNASS